MVQVKVACGIRPAIRPFHDVTNLPRGALRNGLLTGETETILPLRNAVKLPATARRVQHFLAPSGLEVLRPLAVVRVSVGFDLDMPSYRRIRY